MPPHSVISHNFTQNSDHSEKFRNTGQNFTEESFFLFSLPYFMQKINPFERNLGSSDFILRKKF